MRERESRANNMFVCNYFRSYDFGLRTTATDASIQIRTRAHFVQPYAAEIKSFRRSCPEFRKRTDANTYPMWYAFAVKAVPEMPPKRRKY